LGVALTTATQLRLAAVPLGPGEVILVVWILATVIGTLRRGGVEPNPVAGGLIAFWAAAFALLLLGAVTGIMRGLAVGSILRDLLAFGLVALATVLFALQDRLRDRVRRALPLIASFILLPILVLIILGGRLGLATVHVWYSVR